MPSPELSTTLILGEIILIETVLIIALSVYFFLKLKNKSLKLKTFLESFLDDEKNRLSILSSTLKKPEFIDDEKYNTALQNIISEENLFYKYLINAFYKNDVKLLDSLSTEIQKITRPCADLLPGDEKPDTDEINNEPEIDVDDAIDELLSDNVGTETSIENDPEFDLSESTETVAETPAEELVETSIENSEIAEIPNDLLNNIPSTDEDKTESENIPEKDEPDGNSNENENKSEK